PLVVGVDEVALRGRRGGSPGRALQPERPQDPLVDVVLERLPGETADDLAEKREAEVRVVEAPARLEHALDLAELGEELVAGRELERLPDLPFRLALEPRGVREQAADRRP